MNLSLQTNATEPVWRAGDIAQSEDCLPHMQEALGLISPRHPHKPVVPALERDSEGADTESDFQGHSQLHTESEASLGHKGSWSRSQCVDLEVRHASRRGCS